MTPQEPDEQFADLLAEYEGALVHGVPPPTCVRPPAELQARLNDALSCVQMLQQLWPAPATASNRPDDQRGDRYRLLRLHGTGGMGQVWLAEDADLGREVALKEVRPDRAGDPLLCRRFLQEARVTGRLQHPGVVPVYELAAGQDGEPPYYAMRLVRGRTLAEAVADYQRKRGDGSAGPLELHALLRAFVSVCNTVAYAHSQGIIHRDLKTANVVLGDFGEVVLLDWGFAKGLDEPGDESAPESPLDDRPGCTVAGQVVGTPAYMAPEQAAGQRDRIDRRTDVYGLGAILYEILTGRPPFTGADTRELIRQARETEPPRPEQFNPAAPRALAAVCRKALSREPAHRYPDAVLVAREIERWLADEPTEAYRESLGERLRRWGRRHKPLVTALAVLAVVSLAVFTVGLLIHERQQNERASREAAARDQLETHLYCERIALAERELAAHNLARATQLLEECPVPRRGWEWACLQRLCYTDLLVLRGHAAPVSGAVFVLGGQRLVSASHDHSIKIWDAATGKELQTLPGHDDVIHCLAASADGARFATGGWDRKVKVWDAATGRELRTLPDHPSSVIRVAFTPDGCKLASVCHHTVTLWDLENGERIRTFELATQVFGLAICPDGRLLATGDGHNLITLHDLASGDVVRVLRGHQAAPKHLAFSADGRRLAAGDGDTLLGGPGVVKVWDVERGVEIFTLPGHTYPVFSIAFSPDGSRVASGGQDNSIKVWDVNRGIEALTLRGHTDTVRSLQFTPDGARLVSASADRTIRVWDARPWHEGDAPGAVRVLRGHGDQVIGVGMTADGKRIASLSYDQIVKLWDPEAGSALITERAHPRHGQLHSLAASRSALALGTSSGAIVLADPQTGKEIGVCLGFGGGPVKGLAFSADGQRLAAAEFRHTGTIWNVATRKPLHVLKGHAEPVVAVAFDGDRLLASGSYDHTVKLWDATTGQELKTLEGHTSQITSVAVSPDGARVASAANDGTIKLWDPATGKELRELRGHTGAIGGLAFNHGGTRLASASDDWTIKLWDPATGALLQTFRGHTGAVRSLVFSPDGAQVVSGSQDRTVRIWLTSLFAKE